MAVGAAACTSSSGLPGPGGTPSGGTVALPATATALPVFTYDQFTTLLSSLRGKPVVVNFWASWCGPCRSEAPGLSQLAKQYQGKVQFVGVDVADQATPARAFIHQYGWTYPSVADPNNAIKRGFGFIGQPDTIVYASDGTRSWIGSGPTSRQTLQAQLAKVVPA
ncbi:MAG TPA: TlpA disulfide reductase family protein [Actinomycetota bacterium]